MIWIYRVLAGIAQSASIVHLITDIPAAAAADADAQQAHWREAEILPTRYAGGGRKR